MDADAVAGAGRRTRSLMGRGAAIGAGATGGQLANRAGDIARGRRSSIELRIAARPLDMLTSRFGAVPQVAFGT